MTANEQFPIIGKVLRASTIGFVCGTRSQEIGQPALGAFVRTRHSQYSDIDVIGLIHAITIDDDPLVRQIILANNTPLAVEQDQRQNRMVPVEISVLHVGYMMYGEMFQALPPRPPLSLAPVELCDADTVWAFTENLDFLRLVVNANDLPTEDLIAAALVQAAFARPEDQRRAFLVAAGRRLAGLLSADLPRLQHVLRLIRPA